MNNLQELLTVYQEDERLMNIFLANGVRLKGIISEFGGCPMFGGYILLKSLSEGIQVVLTNQVTSILPFVHEVD